MTSTKFTEPVKYRFAVNVKFSAATEMPPPVKQLFPKLDDLMLSSITFENLEEAVNSCNIVVGDIVLALNTAAKAIAYKAVSELNPDRTGQPTLSKEWADNEIAKVWIMSADAEPAKQRVSALGLAQLMEIPGAKVLTS